MKLKTYQIIIAVSIVLVAGLFLRRFEITISNGSNLPGYLPQPATVLPPIPPISPTATRATDLAKGPKSQPIPTPPEPDGELISPTDTEEFAANTLANAKAVGTLRVSNRTEHPVRVALLTKRSAEKSYGKPAHWDFAPGEGSGKGLMLSLEGELKVKQGDILVVFAQDGSRRYWGPYVTGETASPAWNTKAGEWQLVVQP